MVDMPFPLVDVPFSSSVAAWGIVAVKKTGPHIRAGN
jgi:hypothetical protein